MRILVYGAGNMGSLYAGMLSASGHDVSILARGRRLDHLREHGIELQDVTTGRMTASRPRAVATLGRDDSYDLILVVLPKPRVREVLPALAENRGSPCIMFFGNNAAGPAEWVDALGAGRVTLGFPGAAALGARDNGVIRYVITSLREQPTMMGEISGGPTPHLVDVRDAFDAAGFGARISDNMDAWLKTHAAEIIPVANALYAVDGEFAQLARSRPLLMAMVHGIRKGHALLRRCGIPITPSKHRLFGWIPERVLVAIMRRALLSEVAAIKVGHAMHARDEMQQLERELEALDVSAQSNGAPRHRTTRPVLAEHDS